MKLHYSVVSLLSLPVYPLPHSTTNQWDSLTHPFNQWVVAGGGAWTGGVVFVGHCWMGKASAVLVLVGVVLTVVGSTVQVSLQPTSAHRLLTSACMCVPFEMIKPFYVTSTAVHNLTSDVYVCVCKWKSDDSVPLPDKEMCVMWGGGSLPVTTATLLSGNAHCVLFLKTGCEILVLDQHVACSVIFCCKCAAFLVFPAFKAGGGCLVNYELWGM